MEKKKKTKTSLYQVASGHEKPTKILKRKKSEVNDLRIAMSIAFSLGLIKFAAIILFLIFTLFNLAYPWGSSWELKKIAKPLRTMQELSCSFRQKVALGLLDDPSITSMNFEYSVSLRGLYYLLQHAKRKNTIFGIRHTSAKILSLLNTLSVITSKRIATCFFPGIVSNRTYPTPICYIK